MRDSNARAAPMESGQPKFSHGLLDCRTISLRGSQVPDLDHERDRAGVSTVPQRVDTRVRPRGERWGPSGVGIDVDMQNLFVRSIAIRQAWPRSSSEGDRRRRRSRRGGMNMKGMLAFIALVSAVAV